MDSLTSFAICLLAFHQFQPGQSRVPDRNRIVKGDLVAHGEIKYIVVTRNDDHYSCGGDIIDNYYILSAAHCFINGQKQFGSNKITVVSGIIDFNDESDPGRVEVEVEKIYIPKSGIIDDYYILSAAHCYINRQNKFEDKKIKVVAGIIDYKNVNDPRRVEAEVENIYIPRSYNDAIYPNDIALLKLKTSLDIKRNNLTKLSLPSSSIDDLANRPALMAGFGYDSHNFLNIFSTSGRLRKADILIYDNAECQKHYPKDKIYDSYLCGQMIKRSQWREYGVCNGDSGSPLVMAKEEPKVIVGIVSWSYGCDERKDPLVYTRVSKFLTFIQNAMNGKTQNMRIKTLD